LKISAKKKKIKEDKPIKKRTCIQKKALGCNCLLCHNQITERDVDENRFHYIRTKRGTDIFIHNFCWDIEYDTENAEH
jgi:hypothetical protein